MLTQTNMARRKYKYVGIHLKQLHKTYVFVFNNDKTCFVSWLKNFPKLTVT